MTITTNLPVEQSLDSSVPVKQFFDKFFKQQTSFPAAEVDATISYFLQYGFDEESAKSVSIVLLNQARIDKVNVFSLIETLKSLNDVQLSQLVAQILNAYRERTSMLGYRIAPLVSNYESRNILI